MKYTEASVMNSLSLKMFFITENLHPRIVIIYEGFSSPTVHILQVPMNKVNEPAKVPVYIPFLHHPDCYLDILYLHLKVNEEKVRCQEIYNVLCALAR